MNPTRWPRVKQLFAAALDEPPLERHDWLARAPDDDSEIVGEVRELLAEASALAGFLEPPAPPPNDAQQNCAGRVRIGGYTILRELSRGGMGVVYLAEQDRPRRTVALKVVLPAYLSNDAVRRFEWEIEILARLCHPGIAQIFAAGAEEQAGRRMPWFAMELVEGLPLDAHARTHRLAVVERLALFVRICRAVQHAHEHGIVHRDLKPANILVDRSGQPKVLDFGVAHATGSDLGLSTMHTGAGRIVGTLAYMSPEQIRADPRQVDARSDVYALGVVLYELLAHRLPHASEDCAIPELVRRISEDEPARLSSFDRAFRGDLETIVAKALDKDPGRRYESAAALADDIQRTLDEVPIRARPASTAYQLRKFARRNRVLVAGLISSFALLVAGFVGTSWQAHVARAGRARAESESHKAREVQAFLLDLFASVDPDVAQGADTTLLRAMLARAEQRIDVELARDPGAAADLHFAIGASALSLGLLDQAERNLRAALGREIAPEVRAARLDKLALTLSGQGRHSEAEALLREALALQRGLVPAPESSIAHTLNDLGEVLYQRALLARGREEARSAFDAAERDLGEALDLRRRFLDPDHTETARTLKNLGLVRFSLGDLAGAQARYEESLAILRMSPGEASRPVATLLYQLGGLADRRSDPVEAERLWRSSLATYRQILGARHPALATTLHSLARSLAKQGRTNAAAETYRQAADMRRELGGDETELADSLSGLGLALESSGEAEAALEPLREAAGIYRRNLEPQHPWVGIAYGNLGRVLLCERRPCEATELLFESYAILCEACGPDDPRTQKSLAGLIECAEICGHP